jgi:type IV secretory pathway VirD2 relaxase
MRWRAQEIATEELGPRYEFEIRRARVRELTQERFTSLDRELVRLAKDGRLELPVAYRSTRADRSTLLCRLEHLELMGLAERLSPHAWSLPEGWQKELRGLGERGDILKRIHEAVRGAASRYRIVRAGEPIVRGAGPEEKAMIGRVVRAGAPSDT